jgi:SAM-dependent methyltransferase
VSQISIIRRLKRNDKVRRLAARIRRSSPFLWRGIEFIIRKTEPSTITVSINFNDFLHELRSYELRSMPKVKQTMLSAGCSGGWYFDWIRSNYGRVEKHIGVEFYSPKPEGLSSEVNWVVANVQDMHPVENESVDLVFSGQNIEHLWPEELVGFLVESNRVLKDDGILVLDSPNRDITQALCWSHPEHTIELTINEIVELLELSGFKTITRKGIWLCRDPFSNRVLPLNPVDSDKRWPVYRRLTEQHAFPEHSFCWWIEARKNGDINQLALNKRINEIFQIAFPERVNRLLTVIGEISNREGRVIVSNPKKNCGVLIYGPYMPLKPGKYQVEFTLRLADLGAKPGQIGIAQVFTGYPSGDKVFIEKAILREYFIDQNEVKIVLNWVLNELTFGIQYRIILVSPVNLEADYSVKFGNIKE